MRVQKKEVRSAEEGRLRIQVTISGEEEDVNEVFRQTAAAIRELRRRLEQKGIQGVGYKIMKSGG